MFLREKYTESSLAMPNLGELSEDGTRAISAVANVAWLHSPDGLSDGVRNAFKEPIFTDLHNCVGHCYLLYTPFIKTVMKFIR